MPESASVEPGCEPVDITLIHRTITRQFPRLSAAVRAVPHGDVLGAEAVARHAAELLDLLRLEQARIEELWLWLSGRDELPAATLERVERLQRNRERIAELCGALNNQLRPWQSRADRAHRHDLAYLIERLSVALSEYVHDEQAHVVDVAARSMTATQWRTLARRSFVGVPKGRLGGLLCLVLDVADARERAALLGCVPLRGKINYQILARRATARPNAALRGVGGGLAAVVVCAMLAAGCSSSHPSAGPATTRANTSAASTAALAGASAAGSAAASSGSASAAAGGSANAFCAVLKKNGNVLETALEDSGKPLSAAQTNDLKGAVERLDAAAPAEIKSDVQTITAVDLALLNGDKSALKKLDDPQVGTAVQGYATYVQNHCIAK